MVSSAASILHPLVRILSSPSMLFQLLQIFKWIVKIMKNENKPKKRPVSSLENHKLSKNIISWFSNRNVKQRKDTRWVFSNRVTSPSNDNVVFNDTLNNQLALLIVSLNCEQQSGSPLSHSITRCKWWVVMFKTYWYRLWWWWWWSRFTDAYLNVGFAKKCIPEVSTDITDSKFQTQLGLVHDFE